MGTKTQIDAVYAERNALVLAFAKLAFARGYVVGVHADPSEPDWPVLMVDLPTGQVSWHFHPDDRPKLAGFPVYPHEWDGHDNPTKYERLAALKG